MASVPGETGLQEGSHQFGGGVLADNPTTQAQDVGVVVLHSLVSGVVVVSQHGPYSGQFVGRDRRSGARSAHDDASFDLPGSHSLPHGSGEVRIIHRVGRMGPEVDEMVLARHDPGEVVLQRVTRMVRTDGNSRSVLLLFGE